MIMHPTDEALHDWADGTLAAGEHPGVARHLEQCAACAGRVERVRALLARAAAAPRAIEPANDLFPAIRARLAGGATPAAAVPADRGALAASWRRPRTLQLLAAGLAIAVASSALTLWLARDREPSLAVRPTEREAAPAPATTPAEATAQYARAADELAAAWREARSPLDPATSAALDANLRAVDQAIAETRRALLASPDDPLLAEILSAAYRRKVELLRRALELPSWT